MTDEKPTPVKLSPEAQAVQQAKLVSISVVLKTGKAAHLSVPPDYDWRDAASLSRACFDILESMEERRARGDPTGGALVVARSLPPTREQN